MASAHHSRVGARKRTKLKKWSGKMTRESQNGILKNRSTRDIAMPLKRATKRGLSTLRRLFT
jgi:hypothetical protein